MRTRPTAHLTEPNPDTQQHGTSQALASGPAPTHLPDAHFIPPLAQPSSGLHSDLNLREFGLDSGFLNTQTFLAQSSDYTGDTSFTDHGSVNDYGGNASGIWQDLWPDALALFNHDATEQFPYDIT